MHRGGRLDLRALTAFCGIAEHGSLTRAAAVLGLAQSVLSRRVAALERELGGRLFHRTGRGVVPTELGVRLHARARNVLAETASLLDEARGARASPAGTVEVALVPAVARPLVSALARRLRDDYPRIRLRAFEAYSGQVEEWLAAGRVDVGVFNRYRRGKVRDAELLLGADIAVVAPRGRLAPVDGAVPFRALADLVLALPPAPNSLVSALRDIAARQGVALEVALEVDSSALVRDAVLELGLATLVPLHLARRDYRDAAFEIARVVRPAIGQRTWLALTSQRPATIAARTVARLVRSLAAGVR